MMIKNLTKSIGHFFSIILFISCGQSNELKLFNGKSLEDWEGSDTFFRVENGAIVGGSLKNTIDKSYYLCTKKKYANFVLTLDAKFKTDDLQINGGVSFRAKRVPNSNEVMGYQADIGYIDARTLKLFSYFTPKDTTSIYPLWGSLVDENRPDISRYPRPDIFPVIFYKVADREIVEKLLTQMTGMRFKLKQTVAILRLKSMEFQQQSILKKVKYLLMDVSACKHMLENLMRFGIKT